jgi:hypothetical protein
MKKGIACGQCGCTYRSVLESRPGVDFVRRRSQCANCGHRYTTIETTNERRIMDGGAAAIAALTEVLEQVQHQLAKLEGAA